MAGVMSGYLRNSLPLRASLAVTVIALLAITTTLTAGLLAWVSEEDASAINNAGSLRMASYRLNWLIAQESTDLNPSLRDLDARLQRLQRYQQASINQTPRMDRQLQALAQRWNEQLRPVAQRGLATEAQRQQFYADMVEFVGQVDQLVLLLQQRNEHRQTLQQLLQGSALLITLLVMIVGLYELQQNVLHPLRDLMDSTYAFERGQLDTRVVPSGYEEFIALGRRFNDLASTIQASQLQLEERVEQKTRHLTQAYQSLYWLFESSNQLNTQPITGEALGQLIRSFSDMTAHTGLQTVITLCLNPAPDPSLTQDSSNIALASDDFLHICAASDCQACPFDRARNILDYPVQRMGQTLGRLQVQFAQDQHADPLQHELIKSLANLVATALSLKNQRELDHQVVLSEERSVIARELHDSLAQSLSYIKLQVARLETLIHRGHPDPDLLPVTQDIKQGLNNAYRQLRELLTTFRLTIPREGFNAALQATVAEFAQRGAVAIHVDNTLPRDLFSANEQIHVLHIIREALSNCLRHAQAQAVQLRLQVSREQVSICIEDDGVGMPAHYDNQQHHGLIIMQERAAHLSGTLTLQPRHPHGTRVRLSFTPVFLTQQQDQTGLGRVRSPLIPTEDRTP
jgi:two-component system nitrate/nitrite sensor histidine kinase NarX